MTWFDIALNNVQNSWYHRGVNNISMRMMRNAKEYVEKVKVILDNEFIKNVMIS